MPFYHFSNNPENQNFEKMKKTPGNIILQQCTINDNHMMYGSWDKMSFWTIFCCFTPLTTQEIKILKKWKKTPGDIIILHKCTKNHDHMLYCSWDTAHERCNCYFSFWAIFCPFNPLTPGKMKKTPGDIIILHQCAKNHDYMLHCSWDMVYDGCNYYFSFWAIFAVLTP